MSQSDAGICHRFEKRIGSGFLKPSTNRMLNRIKSIYMFIQKNGTVSTQDLVEEFGITPRTIQRDLNVLAYNDLVESPSRGRWTTTHKKVKMSS
ncbi:MAG: DeoR family transcriptional regulator [Bacillus sp. (in: firmicutes)]|jgi:DeoR/GlpR family transcriptional regulator of sugar metabolism|nr:DeoR family transcriptional regulator [Bacillus sp. (in: firmicutes)]